jgi:hypothetical protein
MISLSLLLLLTIFLFPPLWIKFLDCELIAIICDILKYLFNNKLSEPPMGTCLCELVPSLVRKLQGTGAKVSDQTVPV